MSKSRLSTLTSLLPLRCLGAAALAVPRSPYSAVRVGVRTLAFPIFTVVYKRACGGIYRDDVVR